MRQSWMLMISGTFVQKNLKRRLKTKIVSETYPDDSNVRVLNYIKIIWKRACRFYPPKGLQKSFIKQNR